MDNKLRVKKLQDELKNSNIDAMLVTGAPNRMYMSGFSGSSGYLLITQDKQYLFTDFRYIEQANEQSRGYEIINVVTKDFTQLKEVVAKQEIKSIGFEGHILSYDKYTQIKQVLNRITFEPVDAIIEKIRQIKDQEEIEKIRKAAKIASDVFKDIVIIIKPGISEIEIASELEYLMRKKGANNKSFDTIVASGKRSSLPHGTATNKIIQKNDTIVLDYGAVYNGYCSDITRTVFVGTPSDEFAKIYNIVLEAQISALNNIMAEKFGKDIDKIARDIISEYGYGEYFGHALGHGVGIEVHEDSIFSPKSDIVIKENMVITVEPGIYLPELGGVRIEEMILVGQNRCELLTTASKDIIIIE